MTPRSATVVLVTAVALALGGCSGDEEDAPAAVAPDPPTESVTSSPRNPGQDPTWRATEGLSDVDRDRARAAAPPYDSYLVLLRPARGGTAVLEVVNAGRRGDRLAIEAEPDDGGTGPWRAEPRMIQLRPTESAQVRLTAPPDAVGPVRVRLVSLTTQEVMGELVVPEES